MKRPAGRPREDTLETPMKRPCMSTPPKESSLFGSPEPSPVLKRPAAKKTTNLFGPEFETQPEGPERPEDPEEENKEHDPVVDVDRETPMKRPASSRPLLPAASPKAKPVSKKKRALAAKAKCAASPKSKNTKKDKGATILSSASLPGDWMLYQHLTKKGRKYWKWVRPDGKQFFSIRQATQNGMPKEALDEKTHVVVNH